MIIDLPTLRDLLEEGESHADMVCLTLTRGDYLRAALHLQAWQTIEHFVQLWSQLNRV